MAQVINISYYLLILVAVGMAIKQRAYHKPFVYILINCILAFIVQIIAQINVKNEPGQFLVFNGYLLMEWCLFIAFYYSIFKRNALRHLVAICGSLYILWYAFYFIKDTEALFKPGFVPFFYEAPFIILFTLWWFYNIVKTPSEDSLLKNPLFWFNAGHLIYFGLSLLSMGLYTSIRETNPELANAVLNFNRVANFILYSLYIVAFNYSRKTKQWM